MKTRWLDAHPEAIRAVAIGQRDLGPRTRLANAVLVTAGAWLARWVACAGSFLLLLGLWARSYGARAEHPLAETLFVGVGALREEALVRELARERAGRVSILNETSIRPFAAHMRPRFSDLARMWRRVVRTAWESLGQESREGLPPEYRLLHILTRAHEYVWFRAWFSELKMRAAIREPIVFSAASVVSFAAISSGLKCAYWLHGFQSRALVYPDFSEVRCFTRPEMAHCARRLPNANVTLVEEESRPLETQRVVAVAGCYGQTVGYDDCASFIAWAKRNGIAVIVRPHPLDKTGFYERWRFDKDVSFSDAGVPFETFLEQSRPSLILSWYSTALFDALRRGIVPVTVGTETWRPLEMVFPFEEISLRWPHDEARASAFMENDAPRREFLDEKRRLAGVGTALHA